MGTVNGWFGLCPWLDCKKPGRKLGVSPKFDYSIEKEVIGLSGNVISKRKLNKRGKSKSESYVYKISRDSKDDKFHIVDWFTNPTVAQHKTLINNISRSLYNHRFTSGGFYWSYFDELHDFGIKHSKN